MHLAPEFLDVTKLQLVECFVIYSILGWIVESAYMSICTKKLTNRGFGYGPFCPIYGFGATIGAILLSAFRSSAVALFFVAAIGATIFEFIVGKLMQFFLGDFWWDYTDKPFNFQGIICLESTCGWGLYGIGVVYYLHPYVLSRTVLIPHHIGMFVCCIILSAYMIDFLYHVLLALHIDPQEAMVEKPKHMMEVTWEKTRERTSGALLYVEQKTEHAREVMAEKKDAAKVMMIEKRDAAKDLVIEKRDAAMGLVDEKRTAVLDWYRTHRWR
ncbi:MAG: hypothetical protein K6E75_00695 [Lachnospiraceae bacterium]|nr:hypothetical protein [Lachnospiraceae bacterium]